MRELIQDFIEEYKLYPGDKGLFVDHFVELWEKFEKVTTEKNHIINALTSKEVDRIQQRYWEMFLYDFLEKHGFTISCEEEGPDFKIKENEVWVEAITPIRPPELEEFYAPSDSIMAKSVPEHDFSLVLTAALKEKKEKFQKYLESGIVDPCQPQVIAINGSIFGMAFDTETGVSQKPRIVEVCFGIGPMQVSFDAANGDIVRINLSQETTIKNRNDSDVEKTFFTNPENSHISAVIFSNASPWQMAKNGENHDVIIVHNHLAQNPMPISFLKCNQEYYVDEETGFLKQL